MTQVEQIAQVVAVEKGDVAGSEERFQALFHCLLAMEAGNDHRILIKDAQKFDGD